MYNQYGTLDIRLTNTESEVKETHKRLNALEKRNV